MAAELSFPDPPLRDAAVALRPLVPADAPAVAAACADPTTNRFLSGLPVPYTLADAQAWIGGQAAQRASGGMLNLAIVEAGPGDGVGPGGEAGAGGDAGAGGGGKLLGVIGARRDGERDSAEIGYWLTPAARGSGYMSAAVRLLCGWLFEAVGVGRIELLCELENRASQGVAARCGFRQEGYLRAAVRFVRDGSRHDELIWSLLPGELR